MSTQVTSNAERESVRKLCTRLHQAYRSSRLYPAEHPAARRTLEEFVRALLAHLDKWGPLPLVVEEDQVVFGDQPVYFQEDSRGNLAFLMFRDGIRFVSFEPGVTLAEAQSFVDCLSQAEDLASIEYDLTTALWERDLQHIQYEVVDPFFGAGGESLRRDALGELRETVTRRLGELSPGASRSDSQSGDGAGGEGPAAGSGDGGGQAQGPQDHGGASGEDDDVSEAGPTGFDLASITLTQDEMERGEQAVADLNKTTLSDFAVVLLEIAGNRAEPPGGVDVLARSLTLVVEQYLDTNDVDGLVTVVERLHSLEEEGRRPPEFGRTVLGDALIAERLTRFIDYGNKCAPEDGERVDELLGRMRNWILPSLLEALAESSDKAVRKTVLALLDLEGGVPARYLWPLMNDLRWYVVRNAVQLATGSGDPELVTHLERLLRHHDARVRREVMRSLDTLGGAQAAALLARALSDQDPAVRTLAAHGLARHGNPAHLATVQAQVESRDLDERAPEEVAALLWAYAALGGDATIGTLGKIWRRRLFGNRPLAVRSAAVQALGAIGTPAAHEALQAATKSGETQLQRVAARALGGGASGTKGHTR